HLDSEHRRRVFRWRRWSKPVARRAHDAAVSVRLARATTRPRRVRAHARDAISALRRLHRAEFCSLVFVLRNDARARISADQTLWRREARPRGGEIFRLYVS